MFYSLSFAAFVYCFPTKPGSQPSLQRKCLHSMFLIILFTYINVLTVICVVNGITLNLVVMRLIGKPHILNWLAYIMKTVHHNNCSEIQFH